MTAHHPYLVAAVADVLDRHWPPPLAPAAGCASELDRRRWALEDAASDVLDRLDELDRLEAWW